MARSSSQGTLAHRIVFVATAVLACIADQLTKLAVRTWMHVGEVKHLIPGLRLNSTQNKGIAFSLFWGHGSVIVYGVIVVTIVLFAFLSQLTRGRLIGEVAVGIVAGGALGNLIDRVRLGYVTDFIQVPHYAIFNFADICITVGVIGVLALQIFGDDDAEAPAT